MSDLKILIYEPDPKHATRAVVSARQAGLLPLPADSPARAAEIIAAGAPELGYVNLNAERLTLPPTTRRIAAGHADTAAVDRLLFYQPEGVLLYPADETVLLCLLRKLAGKERPVRSLPCNLTELSALVREHRLRLEALLALEPSRVDLARSVQSYCVDRCAFSRPSSELDTEAVRAYKVVRISTGRGHLMCKYLNGCMLHRLSAELNDRRADLAGVTMQQLLDRTPPAAAGAAQTDLTGLLKATREYFDTWTAELILAKRSLCRKTCASARAEGASAPCCETGCVLDNYFDITPPRSDLPPTSALIYENDAKDAVLLAGLCRDHRMAASVAGDAQEAARLLASRHWDFAIVNTELEPIAVPPGTRTMIICRSSVATVARVLAYRPASVITKPFDSTKLSQGFIRAMRLSFGYSTLSAMSTNFSMTLQNFEAALTGWAAEEHNRQNLPASVKYFCENACPQARTREAIPPAELEQYRLLNPFSERGALYCRHRTDCRLWKFQEQVPAEACTFAPVGMLCTDGVTSPETGLLKTIVMIEENVAKTMQRVDRLRLDYCTGQCDQRREDLAPRKGDTIFSSFRESLTRNCFSYCPQQDCPLMCFFEYFRRTIL